MRPSDHDPEPSSARSLAFAITATVSLALAGSVCAEGSDQTASRTCADGFAAFIAVQADAASGSAQGEPTIRAGPLSFADFVRALPNTLCREEELIDFFLGQGWEVDDASDSKDASADVEARLLRFTYTPPLAGKFFRKLLTGFGPTTLVSVKLVGDTVVRAQSQGIK